MIIVPTHRFLIYLTIIRFELRVVEINVVCLILIRGKGGKHDNHCFGY